MNQSLSFFYGIAMIIVERAHARARSFHFFPLPFLPVPPLAFIPAIPLPFFPPCLFPPAPPASFSASFAFAALRLSASFAAASSGVRLPGP